MKRINIIIKLLLAIMLLPTIVACDKENNGNDAMHVDSFTILVKFESPIGTNMLDSLNIQPTMGESYHLEGLNLNWKNKENNLNQHWSKPSLAWFKTEEWFGSNNPNFSFKGLGTVLKIGLCDINISDSDFPKADEEYTITLNSKKIFGNDSTHTIKYYVHINGGGSGYDTKKCEVDGKDYPIIGPYTTLHPECGTTLDEVLVVFKVNPTH